MARCAWCGGRCHRDATSCASCADLERELLEHHATAGDELERELLTYDADREREAADA